MKIIVNTGGYGYQSGGMLRLALRGEVVDVPDDEAQRLFASKEAVPAADMPPTRAEADTSASADVGAYRSIPDAPEPTERREEADTGKASTEMKATELRDMMKRCGIPYKVGMTKADMAAALNNHISSGTEDGELPPDPDIHDEEDTIEDGELPPDLNVEVPSI